MNTIITRKLYVEDFIESFEILRNGSKSSLLISLKYSGNERKPSITKIQRISKPGRRVYTSGKKIPRVLGGFGTVIVSTSHGLMTAPQLKTRGHGGEVLLYVW
jgi:small subunit ribosomal protein S8